MAEINTKTIYAGFGCRAQKTNHLAGECPHCGGELEFFTITEIKNQKYCYLCKKPFDSADFAEKLGLSH